MVSLLVDDASRLAPLRGALAQEGIETRPLFHPAHRLPMYAPLARGRYPVAEHLASRGMNLPSWPDLGDEEVDAICDVIERALGRA
jgi:perosamine synthetase